MCPDYKETLTSLHNSGGLRELRPLSQRNGIYVNYQGRRMINLTSNDYLGIAGDAKIQNDFYSRKNQTNLFDEYGLGAASSRLLTGDIDVAHRLEKLITKEYGRPSALLFNSGYHANIGILPSLLGKGDLILSDKLNHASIHDGMRLSRSENKRFRHCDYDHLESLLEAKRDEYDRVVIVTESVFSMDGDEADLDRLVSIKKKYNCMLYVDEAHSVGLYGERGLGKAEESQLIPDVDLLVGTFGKAYASVGAYVVCEEHIYDYLVNHSRSLIFTTALPPVVLNWNYFVFTLSLEMKEEREQLKLLSQKLREDLVRNNLITDGSTNIVPVMIGDNQKALNVAQKMPEKGYLIFPVRPPAVPEGTARFRLSLTANMQWQDIEQIAELISDEMI